MSKLDLNDISDALKEIDICMMTTQTADGVLESSPMSNNKDVDFDGDCYFFTLEDFSVCQDIEKNTSVNLAYVGEDHFYISLTGEARLSQDQEEMAEHWVEDLEVWFDEGLETEGLTLIHVKASKIKYWKDMEEGFIDL